MSILIKGMEMPKNCGECPFYYYEYKECNAIGGRMVLRNATPPTDCPLIELPHGDLIDRDSVLAVLSDKNAAWDGYVKAKALPVVVESEE